MFIKLTGEMDNADMYFNTDNIKMISIDPKNITYIAVGNEDDYIVKETPEEIMKLINEYGTENSLQNIADAIRFMR